MLLAAGPAAAQMDASAPLPVFAPVVREEVTVPSFLAPNEAVASDWRLEWLTEPIPDVTLGVERNSLQWARVDGVLRLPRGRVVVEAAGVSAGTVRAAGFVQPLTPTSGGGRGADLHTARVLVPFVGGEGNPIDIAVVRDGVERTGRAVLRFAPRTEEPRGERIYVDTTCSPFAVRLEAAGPAGGQWIYVGCRATMAMGESHRTSSLELVLFWDGVGQVIAVDGVEIDAGGDSIWNLRASSAPGRIELAAGERRVTLHYAVSSWPRKASMGIGVGPYVDTFEGTGNDRETVEPLVTLYGSYALSPWSRLVLFNATPIRRDTYSDTGFYLQKRTSETLDRRVVANVFLGGHYLVFTAVDPFDGEKKLHRRFGAPQGVEFLVRDVPGPGFNVIAGGLTNPGFGGTAYYNLWLRWGNPYMFVEVNYIAWQEVIVNPKDDEDLHDVELRSIGISVGFPLLKFL